jgi:hypothetical protein
MPLGALLYLLGFKCMPPPPSSAYTLPPLKCACAPPSYVYASWALLSPLRLMYVPWGLIYAPSGSIMPLGALLCLLRLKCAPPPTCMPPLQVCTPPPGVHAPLGMRAFPPSEVYTPLVLPCAPPFSSVRASLSSVCTPLPSSTCPYFIHGRPSGSRMRPHGNRSHPP